MSSFEERLASHDHGPFAHLSDVRLTGKSLTSNEKTWIGDLANEGPFTHDELTKIYGLSRTCVKKYARCARENKVILPKAGNYTNFIDEYQLQALREKIGKKAGTKVNAKKVRDVSKSVKVAITKTNSSRGKASTAKKPSSRFLKKVIKRINAGLTTKAQQKTKARDREESDLRNCLAESVMLEAFSKEVVVECRINLDATQYRMTKDGILVKVVYLKDEARTGPITREEEDEDSLGLGVKVYNQISASGSAAPLVFHLANDDMPVDELRVLKVPGFGHDCNPNSFSWVVATTTRCGNDAFYRWFIVNSVLPFIADCKSAAGFDDPFVFYSMDGEELQMRNFMSDIFVTYFDQMQVTLGKHSASCSAIGNALDGGHLHMATKTKARHLEEEDIKYAKAAIENHLDETLVTLFISKAERLRALEITNTAVESVSSLRRSNNILKECGKPLITPTASKAKRDMITDRLMRVLVAYQYVLTQNIVVHSFRRLGQVLDPEDPEEDFLECKMATCDLLISEDTMNIMRGAFPTLCDYMREHGNLSEDIMDIWNIPSTPSNDRRSAPKHLRALHQQRAAILNHKCVRERYNEYKQSKQFAPVVRAQKKRKREQESAKNKQNAAQKKTEASERKEQKKKDAEAERQRKQREKDQKKAAKEAAKEAAKKPKKPKPTPTPKPKPKPKPKTLSKAAKKKAEDDARTQWMESDEDEAET